MLLKGTLKNRGPIVRMSGVSLRYVKQVTYLGVTIGERLNFLPHLDKVKEKMLVVVPTVRRLLTREWGLTRRAALTVYRGLFVACATFGAPIWYSAVMKEAGKKRILSCQRVMLHGMLPVCRTVSTEAMQILAGVPPLDLEVIRMAIAFKLKRRETLSSTDWSECSDFGRLNRNELKISLARCVSSRWQSRWDNSEVGRVTFEFIPKVEQACDIGVFGFSLLAGFLLTGHGSLNAFLHKRGLAELAGCSCGSPSEDWKHVLLDCPLYADVRNLPSMGIVRTENDWDVSGVLLSRDTAERFQAFASEAFGRRRLRI